MKFNIVGPAHNISKVSSKVDLINANRVLRRDLLKPRSLVTCNLTHKAANVPHVKLDIRKPSNNQSSTLSPNVLATSCLNTRKQPSPANIPKPSRSVTKLSPLKARKSAHRKSHYDRGADNNNISTNHLRYKSNHLQIESFMAEISRQEIFIYIFIREILLLLMFMRVFGLSDLGPPAPTKV